jgi:hypothetical protein
MSKQEKHFLVCWEKKTWDGAQNTGYTPADNIKEAFEIFNKYVSQDYHATIGAVFDSTAYEHHPSFRRQDNEKSN